jgi:hypothetical protein
MGRQGAAARAVRARGDDHRAAAQLPVALPSARHQVEFFASFHDPTAMALQALGPDRARALKAELLVLARRFDVSENDTLALRLDYLEAVVRKPDWL